MNRIEEPYYRNPGLEPKSNTNMSSSTSTSASASTSDSDSFNINMDSKSVIIMLLIFFIILTFFGITIFSNLGSFIQYVSDVFNPIAIQFLNALGYSAGTALDKVSDVSADIAKGGIDLADGALNNVGGLLKGSGNNISSSPLTSSSPPPPPPMPPQMPIEPPDEPTPDSSENVIQKPISSDKWNWCLVGEYQNKRGCIEITDSDKCFSGQIFPSQKMCLNPTWTP